MRALCAAFLLLALAACNAEPVRPKAKPAAPTEDPVNVVTGAAAESGMNLGTVEEAVIVEAHIAEADRSAGIGLGEQRTYRKDLVLLTVDVDAPAPDDLWVTFTTRSRENFTERPVVAQMTVWREIGTGKEALENREELGRTAIVLGKEAGRQRAADGTPIEQPSFSVDAFGGLDTLPETMLIHSETTLLMMPAGTEESEIDPETATAPARDTAVSLSNPVRINIAPAAETP